MEALKISHLNKNYGRQTILNDINLTIHPGKIYGLLGRNGAGKSTLLILIVNRILPTNGTIKLGNDEINDNDAALTQFYLMSEVSLYPKHGTLKQMWEMADLSYGSFNFNRARRLLKEFDIQDENVKLSNLSTGLQTAAKLIVALSVNANYIFLDEPILGLDANHRDIFYQELLKAYEENIKTYVLSTHLIEEIQQLVEHVFILDNEKITVDADVDDLLAEMFVISGPAMLVEEYTKDQNVLGTRDLAGIKTAFVRGVLSETKAIPDQIKIQHPDLQQAFVYLTNK